jgi:6-phosphogluconolactonase
MNPHQRLFPDAELLSRTAADECVRLAREAVAARGRFTFVLSGGSTPRRLFQLLSGPPWRNQVDWAKVEVFWGDERCVPPDDPESNYRMAHEALLTKVPISPDHVHRIQAERPDLDGAAGDYQAEIARVFGVPDTGAPPSFDLVLLGMGPCGHTASLFPHTAALKETTRWVVANHVPQKNTDRITMTTAILNRAAQVAFLVAGADKTPVLAEVLEGPADPDRLPSQLIRPSGTLTWFLDQAAAAKLTRK